MRGKRRKVVSATHETTVGQRGLVRWRLRLDCGHEVRTNGTSAKRVPTIGHCSTCACAEAWA